MSKLQAQMIPIAANQASPGPARAVSRRQSSLSSSFTPNKSRIGIRSGGTREAPTYNQMFRETPEQRAIRLNRENLERSTFKRRQEYGKVTRTANQIKNARTIELLQNQDDKRLFNAIQDAVSDQGISPSPDLLSSIVGGEDQPPLGQQQSPYKILCKSEQKPLYHKMCMHPNKEYKPPVNQEDYFELLHSLQNQIKVKFPTSEFYRYEEDKFRHSNANRGHDKVSLFNKYSAGWGNDKYIGSSHKGQTNESKEGRKLDIAGYMTKMRPYTKPKKTVRLKQYSPKRLVQPRASSARHSPGRQSQERQMVGGTQDIEACLIDCQLQQAN